LIIDNLKLVIENLSLIFSIAKCKLVSV